MKTIIRIKVTLFLGIALFVLIGFSTYGYKPEKKAVVLSISKSDTIQESFQNNDKHDPKTRNIEHLKRLFRQKAVDEISKHIIYPLKRESPIPSVKDAAELKNRFDEIFDEDLINIISGSNTDQWSEMGWRGIMLDNGILWINTDGKIIAVNHQSEYEKILVQKLTSEERGGLYPALQQNFKKTVYKFKTENYFIRIDELNSGTYRYACWKKENPESTKPDLVLGNGKIEFDGSGGNHVITFKNNNYEYKVFRNKIASSGIADISLVVEKNGKEILSEDGKLEDYTVQTESPESENSN